MAMECSAGVPWWPPKQGNSEPPAAPPHDMSHSVQCWGGVLKGDGGSGCDSGFKRGRRHM